MDATHPIGAEGLGIAHCVGLMWDVRPGHDIFVTGGFKAYAVRSEVGSIAEASAGLAETWTAAQKPNGIG
jgi:uncharacterized metal-binding protein